MKYAIFSDAHGNAEALDLVLKDARQRQVEAYLCLGDIGNDLCATLTRQLGAATVFGNWEPSGWRSLSPHNRTWILNLPPLHKFASDRFWVSHASPTWPDSIKTLQAFNQSRHRLDFGSLFPYYLRESNQLLDAFATLLSHQVQVLFHGHTHRHSVWRFDTPNRVQAQAPQSFILKEEHVYIIGVGSAGQPRDVPKPSYLIFDVQSREVMFVRV